MFSSPLEDTIPSTELFLQPETREITQDQLINEVKGIYAGLEMVEKKCVEIDHQQSQNTNKLTCEQWQALIALHRTMPHEHEHYDFFLASQHPRYHIARHMLYLSASIPLQRLATKYAMPARMWRHGIHSFLELLRHGLPNSLDHMLAFLYLAYSTIALLVESLPPSLETWTETLGDLARCRMSIEESVRPDMEQWRFFAQLVAARAGYLQNPFKNVSNHGRFSHQYHELCYSKPPRKERTQKLFVGPPRDPIKLNRHLQHDEAKARQEIPLSDSTERQRGSYQDSPPRFVFPLYLNDVLSKLVAVLESKGISVPRRLRRQLEAIEKKCLRYIQARQTKPRKYSRSRVYMWRTNWSILGKFSVPFMSLLCRVARADSDQDDDEPQKVPHSVLKEFGLSLFPILRDWSIPSILMLVALWLGRNKTTMNEKRSRKDALHWARWSSLIGCFFNIICGDPRSTPEWVFPAMITAYGLLSFMVKVLMVDHDDPWKLIACTLACGFSIDGLICHFAFSSSNSNSGTILFSQLLPMGLWWAFAVVSLVVPLRQHGRGAGRGFVLPYLTKSTRSSILVTGLTPETSFCTYPPTALLSLANTSTLIPSSPHLPGPHSDGRANWSVNESSIDISDTNRPLKYLPYVLDTIRSGP